MNGTITIKLEDLELFQKMRDAQKKFFNDGRSQKDFNEAKRLERMVDARLQAIRKDTAAMLTFATEMPLVPSQPTNRTNGETP